MSWHQETLYGADSESTGVDVFTDRIVTFTIVKVVDGQQADQREYLIDPGIEIPEAATNVHGITTAHAREHGVHPIEALPEIADTIASILRARLPLVLFNASYDLSLLEVELQRHDLEPLTSRVEPDHWHTVVDPFVLGKGLEHTLRKHFRKGVKFTLPALCERYNVPFTESHQATADATGALSSPRRSPTTSRCSPSRRRCSCTRCRRRGGVGRWTGCGSSSTRRAPSTTVAMAAGRCTPACRR